VAWQVQNIVSFEPKDECDGCIVGNHFVFNNIFYWQWNWNMCLTLTLYPLDLLDLTFYDESELNHGLIPNNHQWRWHDLATDWSHIRACVESGLSTCTCAQSVERWPCTYCGVKKQNRWELNPRTHVRALRLLSG
jgi:hypothetical protein